jgi:hypothetical protein
MSKTHGQLSTEEALALWRDGWRQTHRSNLPLEWVLDYERAVCAVEIVGLRDCHTMADLLARYYDSESLLAPVIQTALHDSADHGRLLNAGLVEDAAFWRRCRVLLVHAVTDANTTEGT